MSSFTFNGERRDYLVILKGRKRPPWAPIKREILSVPGLPGGLLQSSSIEPRILEVPVAIFGYNLTHLQRVKEDLAVWLITDEPKPLVFDDDPTRTYYAMVEDTVDLEEIAYFGKGVIHFICPDPYIYGQEQTFNIPILEDGTQKITVQNNGSAPTYPKFTININQPTTFLDIITPDDYLRIGRPVTTEELEVEREQIVLLDNCGTTTGWAQADQVDGAVSGSMASDGYKFYASNYGTGSGWHGPAIKKSLPEPIKDFIVEVWITQRSTHPNQVGRAEFYLLDVNNRVIGKMAMKDYMKDTEMNYGEARVGDISQGTYIINYAGNGRVWNDFYGILKVARVNDTWEFLIGKYDISKKIFHSRLFKRYKDINKKWSYDLAQIVVHLGAMANYPTTTQFIDKVTVWKINTITKLQVPYIATAGDIIEIDNSQNLILKNGEPFLHQKDLASNFFALNRGQTEIAINPPGIADVTLTIKERWK